jgi:hypothetical protein
MTSLDLPCLKFFKVCFKPRTYFPDFMILFFCMLRFCSYLVLHCSGIALSKFFLYRTSLCLDSKGRFPPSPPQDAAYWPETQRTPLAKEGTNGIWPAISRFFEDSWVLLHAPKSWDMGQIILLPLRRKNPMASVGSEPAILGTGGQHANH